MKPHSFPSWYAAADSRAATSKSLKSRGSASPPGLLLYGCLPVTEFGEAWPDGVPVQVHAKEDDPWFAEDVEAAEALAGSTTAAELFLYPGDEHLFADSSLPAYDPAA